MKTNVAGPPHSQPNLLSTIYHIGYHESYSTRFRQKITSFFTQALEKKPATMIPRWGDTPSKYSLLSAAVS